jgi:hypothetical protein
MFSSAFRSFLLFACSFAVLFSLSHYFSFRAGDFLPHTHLFFGSTIFEWLWISELRSLALRSSLIATLFLL